MSYPATGIAPDAVMQLDPLAEPDEQTMAGIDAITYLAGEGYAVTIEPYGPSWIWLIERGERVTACGIVARLEQAQDAVIEFADETLVTAIAYGIILAAIAEYGRTRRALAGAALAVICSDAFSDGQREDVLRAIRDTEWPCTGH
jgi:hypothetical protein